MRWQREVDAIIVSATDVPPSIVVEPTSAGTWCGPAISGTSVFYGASPRQRARCRSDALPLASGTLHSVALCFVGRDLATAEREAILRELERALVPDGVLLIVDHNRPRRRLASLGALVRSPRLPGTSPIARWRRLAYPAAREAQAVGFAVDRMRLVTGERVQVIVARRRMEA